MSDVDAAWQVYQERLGNRTEGEEAAIRAAFRAGWRQREVSLLAASNELAKRDIGGAP